MVPPAINLGLDIRVLAENEGSSAQIAATQVGDYTDVDPAITAYLQRHKAVGVPLYVLYPRGGGEGRILPVILTPGMVDDALAQAAGSR